MAAVQGQSQPQPQTAPVNKTIPPAALPLISPTTLLQAHLSQKPPVRPSGRTPTQTQPINLNVGSLTHCHGSSVVKIGHTTIICGVRAEVLPVSEIPSYDTRRGATTDSSSNDTPQQRGTTTSNAKPKSHDPIALYNLIVPNLDLSTGCSPRHAPNTAPLPSTQSLTQRLYSLLLTTHTISPHDLEILYTPPQDTNYNIDPDDPAYVPDADKQKVKAYWTLYVDLMCISYGGDGAVFDTAWYSIVSALRDVVLPRAWWDGDENVVVCDSDVKNGKRLSIRGQDTHSNNGGDSGSGVVPLSFGVFDMSPRSHISVDVNATTGVNGGSDGGDGGGDHSEANHKVVLLDMDGFEEECCKERGCVVVDTNRGNVVSVYKSGGGLIGVHEIKEVVRAAEIRGQEWDRVLRQALSTARS